MPKKKPNKFLKINGKVVTLPEKALGNGSKNPVFPNGKNPDVKPFEQRAASEKLAEDFGIIKLTYKFIQLYVNGENYGLFVVEEGFGKGQACY